MSSSREKYSRWLVRAGDTRWCSEIYSHPCTGSFGRAPAIEVLSDSTKDYDRGGKWKHYRQIASFKHYLLVSQDSMEIEQYTRLADGNWLLTDHRPDEDVLIEGIGCRLKWNEVYARVVFEKPKQTNQGWMREC